jgi:hypothetical protein
MWKRTAPVTLVETKEAVVKRLGVVLLGAVLLAAGIVLLVLPGPGLLLVLAGLVTLASEFPKLKRYVDPVRHRAMKAAEGSVASPLRVAVSVATSLALIAAGVLWSIVRWLPFAGWSTGTSLILSGLILLGLLGWSYRNLRVRSGSPRSSN